MVLFVVVVKFVENTLFFLRHRFVDFCCNVVVFKGLWFCLWLLLSLLKTLCFFFKTPFC